MNLENILKEINNLSPAEQLTLKQKIEENMVGKDFYEGRDVCIETETEIPSFHISKVSIFEESVKMLGGIIRQRGNSQTKEKSIITCVCFKIPKGTGQVPLPV